MWKDGELGLRDRWRAQAALSRWQIAAWPTAPAPCGRDGLGLWDDSRPRIVRAGSGGEAEAQRAR